MVCWEIYFTLYSLSEVVIHDLFDHSRVQVLLSENKNANHFTDIKPSTSATFNDLMIHRNTS